MKKILVLCLAAMLLFCSCNFGANIGTGSAGEKNHGSIVGKWIDNKTEQIVEYTADGFYYEYINESFTSDKTRYKAENGKIYYYLDGDEPDYEIGIDYEIKDGGLIIAGQIEYRPMVMPSKDSESEKE